MNQKLALCVRSGKYRVGKFVLFANERDKVEDGKIYHFMNYAGHMNDKITQMECFLENNHSEKVIQPLLD